MQKIMPHLWFDKEAKEASEFYMSMFEDSKLLDHTILQGTPSGDCDMITLELGGQEFILLSAGPYFKFNPSVSFVIACQTIEEVEMLWSKLLEGGQELMPLDSYPFSEKYGWVMDKYGLSWQVMYLGVNQVKQKIIPTLMFVGEQCGKAEEAIQFYTSVLKGTKIKDILRYGMDASPNTPGTVQHMEFTLENVDFAAMDSAYDHEFSFNEAISIVINCDTQEEIDYYWDRLSAVPEAEQCGWLKDKYGFSWQVVPSIMYNMMREKDPVKLANITEAFLKMKKFDIAEMKKSYEI